MGQRPVRKTTRYNKRANLYSTGPISTSKMPQAVGARTRDDPHDAYPKQRALSMLCV